MRNSPSWIALYMGIVMAGGVATPAQRLVAAGGTRRGDRRCRLQPGVRRSAARRAAGGDRRAGVHGGRDRRSASRWPRRLAPVVCRGGRRVALPALTGDDDATILFTIGLDRPVEGRAERSSRGGAGVFNYLAQALVMLGIATEDGKPPDGPARHAAQRAAVPCHRPRCRCCCRASRWGASWC